MTSEQFRDCFVSEKGYDALRKLMKNGNELSTDIAKGWQERYDLEIVYAKGLRKSSETFQKIAGRAKGSLTQAFTTIAMQTNAECEAHHAMANTLLNKICIPMKNLAETQLKARKPIEDALNGKFKGWKDKKETDNKYRQRQFENCKEIESLYLKMDEIPKANKNSVKETGKEVQLVTACVFPGGRHTSASEKPSATLSAKQTSNIETALRKAEQELDKTEKKYHEATREVELARQTCDAEMCRSCDQMQVMELDRINEMEKFIQTYVGTIQLLCETMNQVKQELCGIHVTPQEDIIAEAKMNVQACETEILLYDIYAENEHNAMSQERRLISLLHWMQMLKQDIDIQRRSKDDIIVQADRDYSSDDDGAMHHRHQKKREGIENLQGFCKQNQKFSTGLNPSEICVNRESVRLLQCLYEGSLYKIEKVYNHLKHLPEPQYEHSQRFAKSYSDKGTPTTFLRIPFQPLTQAPPLAPSSTSYLAQSTPVLATRNLMQQPAPTPPPPYSTHQPTPIGWAINNLPNEHSTAYTILPQYFVFPDENVFNRSAASTPPYPVLPNIMTASTDSLRQQQQQQQTLGQVRVLHAYEAQHGDELTIRPGDIIVLLERRSDRWCKGSLNGHIGLFPGNFAQEI